MLALLAAVVLSGPDRLAEALKWAGAVYRGLDPLPESSAMDAEDEATQAYLRLEKVFGQIPQAEAGLGRCAMHAGHYEDAARRFQAAGPGFEAGKDDAQRRAALVAKLKPPRGTKVIQIEPVPGTDRWIALTGHLVDMGGEGREYPYYDLVCVQAFRLEKDSPVWTGRRRPIEKFGNAMLYLVQPAFQGPWYAMVCQEEPTAGADPKHLYFFKIRRDGLGRGPRLNASYEILLYPASATHGLIARLNTTYKIKWRDVYEWNTDRFFLANRRYPELFSYLDLNDADLKGAFPPLVDQAAIYDIHGNFDKGLRMWKRIERICRGFRDPSYDPKMTFNRYGSFEAMLPQVRMRMRWIRRHDYNHPLLYRPYDFDLQVAPHKLGHAGDGE